MQHNLVYFDILLVNFMLDLASISLIFVCCKKGITKR